LPQDARHGPQGNHSPSAQSIFGSVVVEVVVVGVVVVGVVGGGGGTVGGNGGDLIVVKVYTHTSSKTSPSMTSASRKHWFGQPLECSAGRRMPHQQEMFPLYGCRAKKGYSMPPSHCAAQCCALPTSRYSVKVRLRYWSR